MDKMQPSSHRRYVHMILAQFRLKWLYYDQIHNLITTYEWLNKLSIHEVRNSTLSSSNQLDTRFSHAWKKVLHEEARLITRVV